MDKRHVIEPITKQELIDAVNREGIGANHPFETQLSFFTGYQNCLIKSDEEALADIRKQEPGTIGVCVSPKTMRYMCYTVDDKRKMKKCTTHDTIEQAYGKALERYREFAKQEHPEHTDDSGFHYGPLSAEVEKEQDFTDAVAQISETGQQMEQ